MPKLEKFKADSNKPNIKYTIYAGLIILVAVIGFAIYKSYALYKVVEENDVIKAKVGEFDNEDFVLRYTVNGNYINKSFPKKNTGYKYLSMTCENGQNYNWDNDLWGIVNLNSFNNLSCTIDFEPIKWKATVENSTENDTFKKIVYLDPTNPDNVCNKDNSSSTNETKSGCMKWYLYDEDDYSYKLILDHSTTSNIKWNDEKKYVNYIDSNVNIEINRLVTEDNWKIQPRIIYANEIAKIVKKDSSFMDIKSNDNLKFDSEIIYTNEKRNIYSWLFDNLALCKTDLTDYGCNLEDNFNYDNGQVSSYWTEKSNYDDDSYIWVVDRTGNLIKSTNVEYSSIRPVIEIPKESIE